MQRIERNVGAAVVMVFLATADHGVSLAQAPPTMGTEPDIEAPCSEIVRGVTISTRNIQSGVELDFKTPRLEDLVELRLQLRQAAAIVEYHSKMWGLAAQQEPAFESPAPIPPVDISVKDSGAGARVSVRAERAQDIAALRELVQGFEEFWEQSECVKGTGPSALAGPQAFI